MLVLVLFAAAVFAMGFGTGYKALALQHPEVRYIPVMVREHWYIRLTSD